MTATGSQRGAIALAATALLLAGTCLAQDIPELLQPLRHGPLTVWIIGPPQPRIKLASNYAITPPKPMEYKEQTTGSFGESASTFGQTSGSYGAPSDTPTISTRQPAQGQDAPTPSPDGSGYHEQTAGSFGQNAASTGTNASDHGQNAASLGGNAGNTGTNASNHGQTAGSFGQAASSFGVGGTPSGQPPNNPKSTASVLQTSLAKDLHRAFPDLQVRFVDIAPDELKDRLTAASGSSEYPDVLVGTLPDSWGNDLRSRFVLLTIQPASPYNDGLSDARPPLYAVSITTRAPHREAARAMGLWAAEFLVRCVACVQADTAKLAYGAVAIDAVGHLLRGLPIGDLADPDMAAFPPLLARSILMTSGNKSAGDSAAHLQVVTAACNSHLAVVSLRMVAASDAVFGLAHPLVVLRKSSDGQWKVLHVSLNLPLADEELASRSLMATSPNSVAESHAGVGGVKLATPTDDDIRPPTPELSWDNGGGAGLQVVEWQTALDNAWSDPRLFLVNDHGTRLKTQVTAAFAIHQTRYRWRVWSVGAGGETKLTPWRTLNIAE